MANVAYKGKFQEEEKEMLKQGDIVFCEATGGAIDFWGVYDSTLGIISLDGGSNKYVHGHWLYLGQVFGSWIIKRRIPCSKAKITIEELD